MITLLTIVHVFVCLFLIGVVLLQSGRAGGMGVLSGSATQTVFGGRGAGSFLQKLTAACAVLFMITCSALAYISSATRDRGLTTPSPAAPARPATPATPPRPSGSAPAPAAGTAAPVEGAAPAHNEAPAAPAPVAPSEPTPAAAPPAEPTPAEPAPAAPTAAPTPA